ncbi:MAG: hypothetical protein KR126chlam4_00106 [Candidatus Anoxychlamydiales bacterium]|nr:hypothetical protein [Candidatus Anoxychlamydiales bacterium]NGX40289.1 hypothetical protein [Candidatus Anoxychlamydiales bacterium]
MKVALKVLNRFKGYGVIDGNNQNKGSTNTLRKLTLLARKFKFTGEMAPLLPKGKKITKYNESL